jgi:Spy/CpxP family protein refolding chaperone
MARDQIRDGHKAMRDLVTSDSYSLDQVRTLADQQAKLSADLTVARIDSMHRIRQVLTPEQQTKLAEMRAQRKDTKNWKEERSDN